jgi:predicted outer membrane repeat protein
VMVFWVNGGVIFNLQNLVVTKGSADYGGGIRNYGTLHMSNCTVSDSSASHDGGGIYNAGTLTATNCTFSGNSANQGGGIQSFGGSLTLSNCTFSGNSATYRAGGVYNDDGTAAITNTTFSENSAMLGGGIFSDGTSTNIITNSTFSGNTSSGGDSGGNIDNNLGDTVTLRNTIVAGAVRSCTGGYIIDLGNNIDSGESCIPIPIPSSMKNTDPLLGDLANNGGPTQTFALLAGSPAIDAGDDTTCGTAPVNGIDQRGVARPQGAHCDIGAYEKNVYRIFLPLVNR